MRARHRGSLLIRLVPAANVLIWLLFLPPDDGRAEFTRQVIGELIATTAVILFATALVLSTRARWLEPWFGGLDKMYRAHREAGTAGFLVLLLHVVVIPWRFDSTGGVPSGMISFVGIAILVTLSVAPRIRATSRLVDLSYRSWRRTHRFIGFFFIFALAHMLLVDSLVVTTVVPFVLVMGAFVVGILCFLYVLLLARFVRPSGKYVVEHADRLSATALEVVLTPRKGKGIEFKPGQFVFVRFKGRHLREPHPFTVAGSPKEGGLRIVIKATGDFTGKLYETLEPGHRSRVEGAYGMLDYTEGGDAQIWIAGGIGVTPFLSWLRDAGQLKRRIVFFYTVRDPGDALFVEDICQIADANPSLVFHLTVSSRDGSLTIDRIRSMVPDDLPARTVYMCGPVRMIESFERSFIELGVDPGAIHYEEFSFR